MRMRRRKQHATAQIGQSHVWACALKAETRVRIPYALLERMGEFCNFCCRCVDSVVKVRLDR